MITTVIKPQIAPTILTSTLVEALDKPHIVVIEDEEIIAEVLRFQLQPHFNLTFFARANNALLYIQQKSHTIDVIISDYMLPDIDGLVLLSIIKQDANLKHIPVILYTACSKEILDKAKVKPDLCLVKPSSAKEIVTAIRSVLGQSVSC